MPSIEYKESSFSQFVRAGIEYVNGNPVGFAVSQARHALLSDGVRIFH